MEVTKETVARKIQQLEEAITNTKADIARMESELQAWKTLRPIFEGEVIPPANLAPLAERWPSPQAFFNDWLSKNHMSQMDLARLIDMGQSAVWQWCNGNAAPITKSRARLANAISQYDSDFKADELMRMFNTWWGGEMR